MGGEKCSVQAVYLVPQGSPPHGRGKGAPSRSSWAAAGITPAWAGKRPEFTLHCSALWDHPRVGGEKLERRTFWACMVGSPPRGRGKETSPHLYCELSRITPAWAGKSGSGSCYCLGSGDHPRMGGEKLSFLGLSKGGEDHPRMGGEKPLPPQNLTKVRGSPPHGRGKASGSGNADFF